MSSQNKPVYKSVSLHTLLSNTHTHARTPISYDFGTLLDNINEYENFIFFKEEEEKAAAAAAVSVVEPTKTNTQVNAKALNIYI